MAAVTVSVDVGTESFELSMDCGVGVFTPDDIYTITDWVEHSVRETLKQTDDYTED